MCDASVSIHLKGKSFTHAPKTRDRDAHAQQQATRNHPDTKYSLDRICAPTTGRSKNRSMLHGLSPFCDNRKQTKTTSKHTSLVEAIVFGVIVVLQGRTRYF